MEDIKQGAKHTVPFGAHIEIDRFGATGSVSVYGVKSIVDFGMEKAVLKVRGCKVLVRGTGLSISVYENKIVELCGRIAGIEFI